MPVAEIDSARPPRVAGRRASEASGVRADGTRQLEFAEGRAGGTSNLNSPRVARRAHGQVCSPASARVSHQRLTHAWQASDGAGAHGLSPQRLRSPLAGRLVLPCACFRLAFATARRIADAGIARRRNQRRDRVRRAGDAARNGLRRQTHRPCRAPVLDADQLTFGQAIRDDHAPAALRILRHERAAGPLVADHCREALVLRERRGLARWWGAAWRSRRAMRTIAAASREREHHHGPELHHASSIGVSRALRQGHAPPPPRGPSQRDARAASGRARRSGLRQRPRRARGPCHAP